MLDMMRKFIFLFLSMLLPMAAMAAYGDREININITVGGSTIAATARVDQGSRSVILGNGRNACVPHYVEGVVFIPGTYNVNGNDYTVNIGDYAFRLCSSITQVTIGEGSHDIGDCAFVGCSKLEKVTLPSTMWDLGRGAFANLKSLRCMVIKRKRAPQWDYNDVFNFYGTKHSMKADAQKRILYVPAQCIDQYKNTNYGDSIGWKDAFARIYEITDTDGGVVAISNKAELITFRDKVNDGTALEYYNEATSFELTADIEWDLETDGKWIPIGTIDHPFDGSFDGNGHKITGLQNAHVTALNTNYAEDAYTGLFGYASNAYIHNFHMENPRFLSTDYAGCVLGYAANYTRVSDVLVTSDAGSQQYTVYSRGSGGGIVGLVKNGVVERCYFQGRVWSEKGWAGGIVGHMQNGKVEDCAAGSYVANTTTSDNWRLGGIVGGTYGTSIAGRVNVTINRCIAWSNFIIDGTYAPAEQMSYAGWILGYASVPTEITNCAFYVDPNKRGYSIYGGSPSNITVHCENNASSGDNATYTTLNSLKGRNTEPYLGNENWYYFTLGYENYPIPINLKDMYYVNVVYDTDDKGIIYLPVHNESNQIVAYKVKGHNSSYPLDTSGDATLLVIPATHKDKPVTEIMPKAFTGRTDIDILQLGSSYFDEDSHVTAIGDSACMGMSIMTLRLYSNELISIGNSAFEDCDKLGLVELPNSVTTVHKRAFRGCDALTSFGIGSGFKTHDDNFLAYCSNLNDLYMIVHGNTDPNDNGYLVVKNMLLHNVGNYRSYVVACAPGVSGDVVLPVEYLTNSEVNIFGSSFASCDKLNSLTIPASKTYSMGKGVFDGCHNIRYIDMRGAKRFEKENGQPLPWNVERNDPENSFYGLSERTIIWTDATTTCEESEENVIRGNQANSLLLTDGWDFEAKVAFTAGSASLDRVLEANLARDEQEDEEGELVTYTYYVNTGYSVYLPYPLTLTGDNVQVYEPLGITKEDSTTIVTFSEVAGGNMQAYKPYYVVVSSNEVSLENDNEVTVTLQPTDNEDWEDGGYIFSGTTVTIPNSILRTMGAYILQTDNMWHRVPADKELENVYVGPFRSYFHSTASNTALAPRLLSRFINNGSETTDNIVIKTVDNNGDEHYYDLNGRLLPGKPSSGIYIHQGKKYVGH